MFNIFSQYIKETNTINIYIFLYHSFKDTNLKKTKKCIVQKTFEKRLKDTICNKQ